MPRSRKRLAVIAAESGYQFPLAVRKTRHVRVCHDVVRMFMVAEIADVVTHVVQICRGFQHLPHLEGKLMQRLEREEQAARKLRQRILPERVTRH